MTDRHVQLLVEGELDEYVVRRLLAHVGGYEILNCEGKRGKTYIEQNIARFNKAAPFLPCVCLLDLDQQSCVVTYLAKLLPNRHPNLILRIAVCEVESWFIADRENFAAFLGIAANKLPAYSDQCLDPKFEIVQASRNSNKKEIRQDCVPASGGTSKVGKAYVPQMVRFILKHWNITEAQANSPSLDRALKALSHFKTISN